MVRHKKSSVLPHLPKEISHPDIQVTQPMMPGQKNLPSDDWRNQQGDQEAPTNNQQLVPQQQNSQLVQRKPSIAKQGVPWTDRQSKIQMETSTSEQPPPMFSAVPKKSVVILHPRESASQKHVYRMESGIDPVVLLSSRLESWRLAVKSLVSLFKKIVLVEDKTSKGLVTASKEIILPFRKSNGQFLESGGIQDVWGATRDYTIQHGILHHENSNYIQGVVIPSLRGIKGDIKTLLIQIEKDKGLKSNLIFESRLQVDRLITRLDKVIASTQRNPHMADQTTDPFLVNLGIIHAVRELCDRENQLHDNILNLQREVGIFEFKIIESVRHIMQQYQEYRLKNKMEDNDYVGKVMQTFDAIKADTEWNEFVRRNQYNLVMESSAYKTENLIEYPNQDSKFVRAIKIGPLQLKTGMLKGWTEGVYLLTPAGFLHGYKTPKHFQTNPLRPSYSIFVPNSAIESDEDTFTISSLKERRVNLGGYKYVFRAPTRLENQSWFEQLLRIADQFRVIPLLDTTENGFTTASSRAPVHRDLPPLPPSILPLAIDHQQQQQGQEQRQPIGAIGAIGAGPSGTQQPNTLRPVEEEDGSTTPKPANAALATGAGVGTAAGTSANGGWVGSGSASNAGGNTGFGTMGNDLSTPTTAIPEQDVHTHAPVGGTQQAQGENALNPGIADDIDDSSIDNWHSVHENQEVDGFETSSHHSKIMGNEEEELSNAQQGLQDAYAPVSNPLASNRQGGTTVAAL